jgi:hypothetical protein
MHQHPSSHSTSWWSPLPRLLSRFPHSSATYTPEEVRLRLLQQGDASHSRTAAVHDVAARTGVWFGLLPDTVAFELGRAATRLPTIVYWYRQGVPSHEIGRRLSPLGGAWDADRALEVAAALIATALNRPELSNVPL